MQEFLSFAASKDFSITNPTLDGKIHRFARGKSSKKTAWYIGWVNTSDRTGRTYEIAKIGDWKTREEHLFKPAMDYSKADEAEIRKKIAEAQRKVAAERTSLQEEVSAESKKAFEGFSVLATSPYLTKKKIGGLFGARIYSDDGKPVIAVPMLDVSGKFWGYQKIFADGQKLFLTGQRVKEAFHLIGTINIANPVYICEGYATGASIHMATKGAVVCTFSASNIAPVTAALRKKYESAKITICADDDRFGEPGVNAGVTEAYKAAEESQCSVIKPMFKNEGARGTDFNDLHIEEGLDAVKNQLLKVKEVLPASYIPLGFDGNTHFFYSTIKADVVSLSKFGHVDLFNLMPQSYWVAQFPPGERSRSTADWDGAADHLISVSNKIGAFDPRKVRGTGVWLDRKRVVVNTGRSLIVDGKKAVMQEMNTGYVYIQTRNKMPNIHLSPLSVEEARHLVEVATNFKWCEGRSGYLLAGWIAIARIAGALPIRPHVWVTGGKNTGKSTLMGQVIAPALGADSGKLFLQGGSTEAGMRQSIKADSLPVIFDEFETTGTTTAERIASIIELMRQSWSHTKGEIVKGSASGLAQQYSLSFAALVSSIRVGLDTDADHSRFSVLELAEHGGDPEQWNSLCELIKLITTEYGERLFARSINNINNILKNFGAFRHAIITKTKNSRIGDQYGMLLAGYFSLISDEEATPEECLRIVQDTGVTEDQEKLKDEEALLIHIRTTMVEATEKPVEGVIIKRNMEISQIIENDHDVTALLNYGIKVSADRQTVMIAHHHAELKKKLANTRWANDWNRSLLRLPGAKPGGSIRFRQDGSCAPTSRSVAIPTSIFLKDF